MKALYEADGDGFVPTELTAGPWYAGAQHGGPPAALLARAVEAEADGFQPARLTVELLRPVPLAPVTVTVEETHGGRRARRIRAALHAGGTEVARATGLLLRPGDHAVPAGPDLDAQPAPPDDGPPVVARRDHPIAYHRDGVEIRFTRGGFTTPGHAFAWIRLRVPVVAGEIPTPFQRVAAAADFGNGVSAYLHPDDWYYVNPDLTIYLGRLPDGEWVGLEAATRARDSGIGLAESRLYDPAGPVGRSLQSLLVWPRES